MANKVLSIKMDENDVDKLRQYYETLVALGVINKDKLKFNGFLKHLLLDNLATDFKSMMSVYSELGLEPSCGDPKLMDGKYGFNMRNVYNFDEDTFDSYLKCWKEKMEKGVEALEERTKIIAGITGLAMIVQGGMNYTIDIVDEGKNQCQNFWRKKALEQVEEDKRNQNVDDIQHDIKAVEDSDISEEIKARIIEQINQYDKDKRNNYELTKGVRNIGIK